MNDKLKCVIEYEKMLNNEFNELENISYKDVKIRTNIIISKRPCKIVDRASTKGRSSYGMIKYKGIDLITGKIYELKSTIHHKYDLEIYFKVPKVYYNNYIMMNIDDNNILLKDENDNIKKICVKDENMIQSIINKNNDKTENQTMVITIMTVISNILEEKIVEYILK